MSTPTFASTGDLGEKKITFAKLGEGAYAFTAEGDPNTGVIIGDDGVMVIDTQATPLMAEKVLAEIRKVTDKPVKYILLSHYHAVRVLGAAAYGAENIIASRRTYDLIVERGQQDWESEFGRFPRLFQGHETIKSLTWPNLIGRRQADRRSRQPQGGNLESRPRPHRGRHHCLAAGGTNSLFRRPGGVRRHPLYRRRPSQGLGRRPCRHCGN